MAIPMRQRLMLGAYLARQTVARRKQFPLIVELEPLFACNLECAGCGKIQYPTEVLRQRVSVEDAVGAIEESGAPMVSIAGVSRCCIPTSAAWWPSSWPASGSCTCARTRSS